MNYKHHFIKEATLFCSYAQEALLDCNTIFQNIIREREIRVLSHSSQWNMKMLSMTINEMLMKAPFYRKECNPPSYSSVPHHSSSNIGICMSVYIFLHHLSSLSLFLCLLGGITQSEYILWVEASSLIRAVKSTTSPFSYSC